MPRRARCVLPGMPYHVTQRGVDRRATFSADEDRHTYLRLLGENLGEAEVRLWVVSDGQSRTPRASARKRTIVERTLTGGWPGLYSELPIPSIK